jgi:CheY-like chemotaxis protein
MRILLAEDDEDTAGVLRGVLTSLGHRVTVATEGLIAWQMFQEEHIDLVLSDWTMPGLDGLELCRRIRGRTGQPYTYFVLLTGRVGRDDRLEALAAGADDFLAKPFDTGDWPPAW